MKSVWTVMAAAMVGLTACSASLAQTGGAGGAGGGAVTTPSEHLGGRSGLTLSWPTGGR